MAGGSQVGLWEAEHVEVLDLLGVRAWRVVKTHEAAQRHAYIPLQTIKKKKKKRTEKGGKEARALGAVVSTPPPGARRRGRGAASAPGCPPGAGGWKAGRPLILAEQTHGPPAHWPSVYTGC